MMTCFYVGLHTIGASSSLYTAGMKNRSMRSESVICEALESVHSLRLQYGPAEKLTTRKSEVSQGLIHSYIPACSHARSLECHPGGWGKVIKISPVNLLPRVLKDRRRRLKEVKAGEGGWNGKGSPMRLEGSKRILEFWDSQLHLMGCVFIVVSNPRWYSSPTYEPNDFS